jgi:hypothetical protein
LAPKKKTIFEGIFTFGALLAERVADFFERGGLASDIGCSFLEGPGTRRANAKALPAAVTAKAEQG